MNRRGLLKFMAQGAFLLAVAPTKLLAASKSEPIERQCGKVICARCGPYKLPDTYIARRWLPYGEQLTQEVLPLVDDIELVTVERSVTRVFDGEHWQEVDAL